MLIWASWFCCDVCSCILIVGYFARRLCCLVGIVCCGCCDFCFRGLGLIGMWNAVLDCFGVGGVVLCAVEFMVCVYMILVSLGLLCWVYLLHLSFGVFSWDLVVFCSLGFIIAF